MEELDDLYASADEKKKKRYDFLKTRLQKQKNSLKYMRQVIQIVDCFNEITGRRCDYHTMGNLKLILYWLREGYGVKQFQGVFEYKFKQFTEDKKPQWINIDTMCRQDKFENNLENAREAWRKAKNEHKPESPAITQQVKRII